MPITMTALLQVPNEACSAHCRIALAPVTLPTTCTALRVKLPQPHTMKQLLAEPLEDAAAAIWLHPVPKRPQENGSAALVACGAGLGALKGGAVSAGATALLPGAPQVYSPPGSQHPVPSEDPPLDPWPLDWPLPPP
jgi:hypothetical protein